MREMPILQTDGTLDNCTVGIVQACMMYPDDPASIDEDISAYRIRAAAGFRDTQLARRMNAEFQAAKSGGLYAGAILFSLAQFSKFRPDLKISVNKATHLSAMAMLEEQADFSKNISTIKAYWSNYKNAAHLWAAFMLVFENKGLPVDFVSVVTQSDQLAEQCSKVLLDWSPWRAPKGFPFDGSIASIEEPRKVDVERVRSYRANAK